MDGTQSIKELIMSTILGDVKSSIVSVLGLTAATVAGTASLTARGAAVAGPVAVVLIGGTLDAAAAVYDAPKSAAIGYIADDRDISIEEASEVVEASMPNNLAEAISLSASKLGKMTSKLLDGIDDDEEVAPSK